MRATCYRVRQVVNARAAVACETARIMSETSYTLAQPCRHQEEIKKSRFLALAAPVNSGEQALAFVHEVSDPAATHNCWAYRIGQDYRFNDDGEPGGTVGPVPGLDVRKRDA